MTKKLLNIKPNLKNIVLATLFFPFVASIIVWRKGKNNLSKILATGLTIAITLPIWLAFLLIGYNVLSGKYRNDQKHLSTQKICPESNISDPKYFTHKDIPFIEDLVSKLGEGIATVSALLDQTNKGKILIEVTPKIYEVFKEEISGGIDASLSEDKIDAIVKQHYDKYLVDLEQLRKDYVVKKDQAYQPKINAYTTQLFVEKESKKYLENLIKDLQTCIKVSREDTMTQLRLIKDNALK